MCANNFYLSNRSSIQSRGSYSKLFDGDATLFLLEGTHFFRSLRKKIVILSNKINRYYGKLVVTIHVLWEKYILNSLLFVVFNGNICIEFKETRIAVWYFMKQLNVGKFTFIICIFVACSFKVAKITKIIM